MKATSKMNELRRGSNKKKEWVSVS